MLKEQKIDIINQAIKIIQEPKSWTAGPLSVYYETIINSKKEAIVNSITVHPTDDKATAWCAMGAIIKVSPTDHTVRDEAREFCMEKYGITLGDMNDIQGRKKVITVLEEYRESIK